MSEEKLAPFSVRLSRSDREKLSKVADATIRTRASWLRWVIRQSYRALENVGNGEDEDAIVAEIGAWHG